MPKYLETEKIRDGIFLVVIYSKEDLEKVKGIYRLASKLNNIAGVEIKCVLVDARSRVSASNLKPEPSLLAEI